MNPIANFDPQYAVYGTLLVVLGVFGLLVTARTMYLGARKLTGFSPVATIAAVTVGAAAIIAGLTFGVGAHNALMALLCIGATDMIIMGTPLSRYHALVQLDPEVAQRVKQGPRSWFQQ